MKKAFILSLLPVFLYGIIGWQWMFVLSLNDHQAEEWSAHYNEGELEIITVKIGDNNNSDTYLVNDNELFHHGKYFDIKYKKRSVDEMVFYCHPDHEEEGLYASLDQHVKDGTGTTSSSNQKLLKIFKVSDFEKDNGKTFFIRNEICDLEFQFRNALNPFPGCNSVFVPPDAACAIS
jgi:hypothetical protein